MNEHFDRFDTYRAWNLEGWKVTFSDIRGIFECWSNEFFFVALLLLCLSKIIFLNHYSFPNLQISRQLLSNIIFDKWIHFLKNISTIFFIEYIWKLIRELLSYYFFVHLKSWWIKNNFSFDLLFSNVTFPNLELQISRRLF